MSRPVTCRCGARLQADGSCPWGCPQDGPKRITPDDFAGWTPYEGEAALGADQHDDQARGGGRWWAA